MAESSQPGTPVPLIGKDMYNQASGLWILGGLSGLVAKVEGDTELGHPYSIAFNVLTSFWVL